MSEVKYYDGEYKDIIVSIPTNTIEMKIKLKVYENIIAVFSPEEVSKDCVVEQRSENKLSNVGTISYMPAMFGCTIASVVIRELIGIEVIKRKNNGRNDRSVLQKYR